jgi:hypothetical protein
MTDKDCVSQPLAALLTVIGWEEKTHWGFRKSPIDGIWGCFILPKWIPVDEVWLPAPSIGELRWNADGTERLTKTDLWAYYAANSKEGGTIVIEKGWTYLGYYSEWLYTVTASADALATVWLWVKGKEKP